MKKHVSTFLVLAALAAVPALPASALTSAEIKACKAMGASIQARHADLQEQGEARLTLAEAVETAGAIWEDAEVHRLASKKHAADADAKKAAYEEKKAVFTRKEMAYQADAATLNHDVEAYNAKCSAKKG